VTLLNVTGDDETNAPMLDPPGAVADCASNSTYSNVTPVESPDTFSTGPGLAGATFVRAPLVHVHAPVAGQSVNPPYTVTPSSESPTVSTSANVPVAQAKTRPFPDDFASAIADAIEPSGEACVPVPVPPATTNTPNESPTTQGSTLGSSLSGKQSLLHW
jgi:hypothetical protein